MHPLEDKAETELAGGRLAFGTRRAPAAYMKLKKKNPKDSSGFGTHLSVQGTIRARLTSRQMPEQSAQIPLGTRARYASDVNAPWLAGQVGPAAPC